MDTNAELCALYYKETASRDIIIVYIDLWQHE